MRRLVPVFPLVLGMVLLLSLASGAQQTSPSKQAPAKPAASSAAPAPDTERMDPNDPLFGVPPLPPGKVSLIGGIVQKIDRVRNRVTLRPFGEGKKMTVLFDERTHIFRDSVETTERGIQRGDRVYVDTMLDGPKLFARNIRVVTQLKPADARGQIVEYNARAGLMTVRDELSATPVSFHVSQATTVQGAGANSRVDLVPGALVEVRFSRDPRNRDVAQKVSVLAMPGMAVTFAGKVRFLDMSRGTMSVENASDNNAYDISFDPGTVGSDIMVGSDVTIAAEFAGRGYKAKSITLNAVAKAE